MIWLIFNFIVYKQKVKNYKRLKITRGMHNNIIKLMILNFNLFLRIYLQIISYDGVFKFYTTIKVPIIVHLVEQNSSLIYPKLFPSI